MSDVSVLLKSKRKDLELSVKEVVDKLRVYGVEISDKTLYGWESGHRQPDADTFLVLCRIYGINSFPDIHLQSHLPFSDSEMRFIKKYRTLDEYGKEAVDSILDIEYRRIEFGKSSEPLHIIKQAARNGEFTEEILTDSEKDQRVRDIRSGFPVDDL